MEFNKITSLQKKFIHSLKLKNQRLYSNLFIVESIKLCQELLNTDYKIEFFVITDNINQKIQDLINAAINNNIEVYYADNRVFDYISDMKNPEGILAVANIKEHSPDSSSSFIALDSVNDPGNVGTIIRTAEWFGFNQIILTNDSADIYNSKTVRATMGSLFRSKIIQTENLSEFIANNFSNHILYGAVLNSDTELRDCNPDKLFGIILGSESHGISNSISNKLHIHYKISGYGNADSLNVAIASAISLYHFSEFII